MNTIATIRRLGAFAVLGLALVTGFAAQAVAGEQGKGYIEPKLYVLGSLGNSNITSPLTFYGGKLGVFATDDIDLGVELLGVYLQQYKHNPSDLANVAGINSAMFGFPVTPTTNQNNSSYGLGGNAVVNWHFFKTAKASAFAGLGLGYFGFNTITPVNSGSQSAVAENLDLGFTAGVADNVSLTMTARYQHLGAFSEKGINGLGGGVGLAFSF